MIPPLSKRWLVLPVCGALALGVGYWAFGIGGQGAVDPRALSTVRRGTLEIVVTETGRIEPLAKVDIKSKVAGQVARVGVREGESVARGAVLLELDTTDYRRQLAQAEADRDMVRAELAALVAGARAEELAEARAMRDQAQARARRAREDRDRAAKALQAGSLTPREWEAARAEGAEAEAGLAAAASKLARLRAGTRPEEVAQARARLAKAAVAVQAAKDQLAACLLRAPIAGVVIHKGIEVGEMVTPGVSETGDREPLLTVADLSRLVVESRINQVDVGKLEVGQPVSVRVDSLPEAAFAGRVHKVAPAAVPGADPQVRLFPVQTLLSAAGGRLRPGMSADLDVFVEKREGVLLLPVEAVRRERPGMGSVTVVRKGPDGRWQHEARAVKLGASSDHEVEVESGLAEGEQVLVSPPSAKDNVNQF